jgi:hypothetical protein
MSRERERKNTYSQTSRLENPEELQLHQNNEKILFLTVLLLFAQCKMHYWWLVTWLDLTWCETVRSDKYHKYVMLIWNFIIVLKGLYLIPLYAFYIHRQVEVFPLLVNIDNFDRSLASQYHPKNVAIFYRIHVPLTSDLSVWWVGLITTSLIKSNY